MTLCDQLITVTDVFCAATGKARGTLSAIILKRGSRLDEIAHGTGDVTTRNFERSMSWLSANWPVKAEWPEGVTRPVLRATDHDVSPPQFANCGENGADTVACPVLNAVPAAQAGAR